MIRPDQEPYNGEIVIQPDQDPYSGEIVIRPFFLALTIILNSASDPTYKKKKDLSE